jgi:hypothetical protein
MKKCFTNIAQHKGKVLAVFTSQALTHYNVAGQFVRALGVNGLEDCCEEVFWPLVTHLYSVELHRDRLVKKVSSWGRQHFSDLC